MSAVPQNQEPNRGTVEIGDEVMHMHEPQIMGLVQAIYPNWHTVNSLVFDDNPAIAYTKRAKFMQTNKQRYKPKDLEGNWILMLADFDRFILAPVSHFNLPPKHFAPTECWYKRLSYREENRLTYTLDYNFEIGYNHLPFEMYVHNQKRLTPTYVERVGTGLIYQSYVIGEFTKCSGMGNTAFEFGRLIDKLHIEVYYQESVQMGRVQPLRHFDPHMKRNLVDMFSLFATNHIKIHGNFVYLDQIIENRIGFCLVVFASDIREKHEK